MNFSSLVNPNAHALSDTVDAPHCVAFTVDVGGTLSYMGRDGVVRSMLVTAGVVYPFSIKRFRTTGTTGVSGVTVWN